MLSLILTIFFVHVAIYLVNTAGASTIDTALWALYLKLPTSTAKNAREQSRLKREVVQLNREMNNTSSQDEFAKWAKLRRRHDKAKDEYETINQALTSQKTSFDWAVKIARWLSTSGLKIFLQFYYSKTPVFALPAGWFPSIVEWMLSFPRAPRGSVSVQVWNSVCATAIAVMAEIFAAMLVRMRGQAAARTPAAKAQKTQ
ncbi:guided entry of tail-anchored proteins factor 1 [Aspergillus clavatus NRRL 1]|uniref:Protein get1 n=1 Tax=Aspergillus clavatus (strain ATCC 1007 / CBS 513.65 / DSM 816 / NCTC 3887 / NRRL 1 / QM 1276 / 107) TaxID=344612 RepID=GET1_ASPCL|nr:CHD5 domain protein [Aspergillus clavatus NRRL 1]A1CGU5.1 RecName: Full=Protein get1; AltName: Full=Guided entry of tail-anchored proteins 1 [Aspergillus clavatus NRRL 1]EAW10100.1 CHD5 domain protein [Aspergillus clavatus NRRL 1]